MNIILNGIELNPNLVWLERFQPDRVAQTMRRTLGGRAVVFSGPLLKGEPLTLEATLDHGWLTKTTVEQLIAMADMPGETFSLTFDGKTFLVAFRHEDPPALQFTPIVPRVTHEPGDYFTGQIKLITV